MSLDIVLCPTAETRHRSLFYDHSSSSIENFVFIVLTNYFHSTHVHTHPLLRTSVYSDLVFIHTWCKSLSEMCASMSDIPAPPLPPSLLRAGDYLPAIDQHRKFESRDLSRLKGGCWRQVAVFLRQKAKLLNKSFSEVSQNTSWCKSETQDSSPHRSVDQR